MKVELGQRVKDKMTGLTGIATARAKFLYGCVRVCVQPEESKEGKPADLVWFDEPQLDIVDEGLKALARPGANRHGPREDATRRSDAR